MKKYITKYGSACLLALCMHCNISAQSIVQYVTAGGGGSGTIGSTTFDFTIGESQIATVGIGPIFTQGFQQPDPSGVALPLRLVSFAGVKQGSFNKLSWVTANEQQTEGFQLLRSNNSGSTYFVAGNIPTQGSGDHSYNYADTAGQTEKTYYKLKMNDIDGHFTYSNVVVMYGDKSAFRLVNVYPRSVDDVINISTYSSAAIKTAVVISDASGRVLIRREALSNGSSIQSIDGGKLAAGSYFITILAGDFKATEKFIKL